MPLIAITPPPQQVAPKPEKPAGPITGQLISVDDKAKTLIVKINDETEMKFSYSDATEIVGGEMGREGLAKSGGAMLTITYDEHGTANVATKIVIAAPKI